MNHGGTEGTETLLKGAAKEALRAELLAFGFDGVRFARVEPGAEAPGGKALQTWLGAGMQADMGWLERNAAKRQDPQLVLEGARTMIVLGVNYLAPGIAPARQDSSGGGAMGQGIPARMHAGANGSNSPGPVWARYSLWRDYHDTITPALARAGLLLQERLGIGPADHRYYTDTGPVLERGWAARAGVGFVGKNAMLISRDFGNWLFLAAILVRAELEPDAPLTTQSGSAHPGALCGKCTRCLEACPTKALVAPGTVDARLCISYLTIENKGAIPEHLRPLIGDRIYGCDICAEVCPWNRFAREGRAVLLEARGAFATLPLERILSLDTAGFAEVFRGTAVKRIKRAGLLRNACVVAGNVGGLGLLPVLDKLAADPAEGELVREHAAWAAGRVRGRG